MTWGISRMPAPFGSIPMSGGSMKSVTTMATTPPVVCLTSVPAAPR
ncbi:hypothetical protein [Nonomuraea sp. NPDC049480]